MFIKQQGLVFRHALRGPGIWDHVLAITIWHEMSHLGGADEQEAQRSEEGLWQQFITSRQVDFGRGLAYLQQMKKRRLRSNPSPDALDSVFAKDGISGDDGELLGQRLRDQ